MRPRRLVPRWRACPALLLVLASACGHEAPSPPPPSVPVPVTATTATALAPCPVPSPTLGPGLTVERWALPDTTPTGCIDVLRADPQRFTLSLLSQTSEPGPARDARTWLATYHLSAVINAGMFHATGAPVGLVVSNGVALSPRNTKMSGYLAWDPVDANDPPFSLASATCGTFDLDGLRARYHSVVQSYRLLDCDGAAISWLDPTPSAATAIALDRAGRIVLLHSATPVPMAQLSRGLAAHDLVGAIFLEGGSEASLYAKGPEGELARTASLSPLPNVIALLPR